MNWSRFLPVVLILFVTSLSSCAPQLSGYRDQSAPIGATTRFDAQQFSGQWIIAASFTPQKKAPITFVRALEGAGLRVSTNEIPRIAGFYREGVPGELIPLLAEQETLVVMWVDDDFRTAAIGTASGSLGLVLDREGELPADRAQAVRDILDFYGWDTSQLKRTY